MGKMGELEALSHTTAADRARLRPIIQAPVSEDVASPEQDALKFTTNLAKSWDNSSPLIVDSSGADGIANAAGDELVLQIHTSLRGQVAGIPVVTPVSSADFLDAIKIINATDNFGACIRLTVEDLANPSGLASDISSILTSIKMGPSEVDLVVDLGFLNPSSISLYGALLPTALPSLPHVNDWRSLVLLSGAFPEDLSALSPYAPQSFARHDADLWHRIASVAGRDGWRVPEYADYATSHPATAVPNAPFRSNPNLRYTLRNEWYAVKSDRDRILANRTMFRLCADLRLTAGTAGSLMKAASFSWGDAEYRRCADGRGGPGNGAKWKAWSTSHHLAAVLDGLATTGAP